MLKSQRPSKRVKTKKPSKCEPANDSVRITIQKENKKFRHFIFGETQPGVAPQVLCSYALNPNLLEPQPNLSYVLFAHGPQTETDKPCCMRGLDRCFHYHLLICSSTPREDAKKVQVEFNKIFTEISVYQLQVLCPLTEYAALIACDTTNMMTQVGDTFTGLDEVLKLNYNKWTRFTSKKFDSWATAEPAWEMHKHSQIKAQEQMLQTIHEGPFRPLLQRVLAALANAEGCIDYNLHGWRLHLECGAALYQCVCKECCLAIQFTPIVDEPLIYDNVMIPQGGTETMGETLLTQNDFNYEFVL